MIELIKLFFYKSLYNFAALIRAEWIWGPLKKLLKSQYFERSELENIQLSRLNKILSASKSSPYYQRTLKLESLNSLDEIKTLPFLEKEHLRLHSGEMITNKKPIKLTIKTSGGSTGAPITIKKPSLAVGHELAAAWRGYSWAGIQIGELQGRFWGVPSNNKLKRKAQLIDFVTRRIRFSAFKFNQKILVTYLKSLESHKNIYFYGYASMIRELANQINISKKWNIHPKAIITTSEVLTNFDREFIEKAFNCKVYNEYGCGEVGTIAHECERGSMHINIENLYVEIVNESGDVLPPDSVGEIVVTDLSNDYMPLIRYRIRDFGSISSKSCPCGRTLPVLENLKGRAYEFLENEHGEKFHGEFFLYIIEEFKSLGHNIHGIQFIKNEDNLKVLIISDEDTFQNAKIFVGEKIRQGFSNTIPIDFEKVEFIPRESSGKLRVIKNSEQ